MHTTIIDIGCDLVLALPEEFIRQHELHGGALIDVTIAGSKLTVTVPAQSKQPQSRPTGPIRVRPGNSRWASILESPVIFHPTRPLAEYMADAILSDEAQERLCRIGVQYLPEHAHGADAMFVFDLLMLALHDKLTAEQRQTINTRYCRVIVEQA